MATSRYNPSFLLFPIQNNRTGWKPVWLPVVLTVPARRDPDGNDIPNSDVFNVKYFIENAPGRAKVAGFKYQGIYVPALERFVVDISFAILQNYIIDLAGLVFIDQDTGAEKDYQDARNGDSFYLTLENGNVTDTLTFYRDVDYYDLSPISISTVDLKPYGVYNFVWQASYNQRILTPDDELFCIGSDQKLTRFAIQINHPGDVHRGMVESTPSAYFDGESLDQDSTVDFYRPFADALQDIFDEQTFIRGINWTTAIPVQYIPYLGFLIGWDPPYFGGINDDVRLSFIRNARKIQKLKGSKRAVWELFEIFGFTIDIVNLWYSTDGQDFIGPYDPIDPDFPDEYVTAEDVCTTEPLVADNKDSGFGEIAVPLLHRPTDDLTIEAWLVVDGTTQTDLNNIVNNSMSNPSIFDQEICNSTQDGVLISDAFDSLDMSGVIGHAKVAVDIKLGHGVVDYKTGSATIGKEGVRYNRDTNTVSIIYDGYLDLSSYSLFIFAIYHRQKITPSTALKDLRSNRFDIRVLLFKDGEQPDSDLYDFLVDFLFKIKAFHSLLRKISFTTYVVDVYNVTDFCVGGLNKQAIGLDAGELQVPPAIIPTEPTCVPDQVERGFKDSDIKLRETVMNGLQAEHESWKNLDGTHYVPANLKPIIDSLSRIPIPEPEAPPCEFTQYGQERVLQDVSTDFDHHQDDRAKLCSLESNTKNYCYKGRTKDELLINSTVLLAEYLRCSPCSLMAGQGLYWYKMLSDALSRWKDTSNINQSWSDRSFVRRAAWNDPLHYTNRSLISPTDHADAFLAIRKPSLNIQKNNMFFPGHRFVQMFGLLDDFTSSAYDYRPWDDILNLPCPEDVPVKDGQRVSIPNLNAHLVTDTDGNEWLVFDPIPLTYFGNGLPADISSLGDHDAATESEIGDNEVTHAIYTSAQPLGGSGEELIQFDGLTTTDETSICTDPIFRSANRSCDCGTDASEDFIDGYPSVFGRFPYDDTKGFIGDDVGRLAWADLLDIPVAVSDTPDDMLFKVGSGIKTDDPEYAPYRLDCGCLKFECESGGTTADQEANACNLPFFYEQNGDLNFDCDKVDIFRTMILPENISTCSYRLNGEISNLFMLDENKVHFDTSGPVPVGWFRMKDNYGTILTAYFRTAGDTLDITWISFEPRVWGEPDQGYTDGRKVFKRGILTTQRQILKTIGSQIVVTGEWQQQAITTQQINAVCGEQPFVDPFLFHTDCAILDFVEFDIICGPRWSDPSKPQDHCSWPDIGVDSEGVFIGPITGDTQFFWIDAWGNDEGVDITGCLGTY